jgi:hypothetical protein
MLKFLTSVLITAVVCIPGPAWSYDKALAESYASLFAPVKGADAGKSLHLIKPDTFLKKVTNLEPLVALDIRTPAETGVFGSTLPGT